MKATLSVFVAVLMIAVSAGAADQAVDVVNPAEPSVSNPAPLTGWAWPEVVLYDNGPLVTHPGGGAGGADASAVQTALLMSLYGFGFQNTLPNRMADDFTVTDAGGWQIDDITFFGYQTGSTTTSTFTGIYVQIWNGAPNAGGTVVWGDLTTNRMTTTGWSNIYRVLDTTITDTARPVMSIVANVGTTLAPGTYWVDFSATGSLASGPWAPPISVLGQHHHRQWAAVHPDRRDVGCRHRQRQRGPAGPALHHQRFGRAGRAAELQRRVARTVPSRSAGPPPRAALSRSAASRPHRLGKMPRCFASSNEVPLHGPSLRAPGGREAFPNGARALPARRGIPPRARASCPRGRLRRARTDGLPEPGVRPIAVKTVTPEGSLWTRCSAIDGLEVLAAVAQGATRLPPTDPEQRVSQRLSEVGEAARDGQLGDAAATRIGWIATSRRGREAGWNA